MDTTCGELFQEGTKYRRGKLPGGKLDWAQRPAGFKSYPGNARRALPPPGPPGGADLWEALRARRSVRDYSRKALSLEDLSLLLWAGQGVSRVVNGFAFRTAPSAGALYPIETYLSAQNVEGLDRGLFHYNLLDHTLEDLRAGDVSREVAAAALDQDFLQEAGAVIIWTAFFDRSAWKYRQRAYRYVYLDAGHIAQNLALAATALGLGTCQVAALYDDEVNALLGLDGRRESVLYMSSVGRPA